MKLDRIRLPIAISMAMVSAVTLAGCVNPVKSVTTLPADEVPRTSVAKIEVMSAAPEIPVEVRENLKAALEKHLANCAGSGDIKRVLLVRLDNFKKRNIGAVMLIGDSNDLAGQVRFVDTNDADRVIGEYYVDEVQTGGGLLGLALLDNAEKNMPERFAKSVCKRIFNKESTVPAS